MDKKELDKLLFQMQSGEKEAFEKFYNMTNKNLFSFVYVIVKSRQDAEDIVQETYIKIKLNLFSYKVGTNPSAWIFQIAKNLALDSLRKDKKENACPFDDVEIPDKTEHIDRKNSNLYLHDLMNKFLSLEERQIISLHVLSGYKHREIAKFLNLPLGTVLWKYNRALKVLKENLKEQK
jgi:RNA polymerase sigma-70 factor (ECF subfamily)